jgi:hypothetical protein
MNNHPLDAARGLVHGVLGSAVLWIVLAVLAAFVFGGWCDKGFLR